MTCECARLHEGTVRACQECGTRCCRSCAVEIGGGLYCRWCAGHTAAPVA